MCSKFQVPCAIWRLLGVMVISSHWPKVSRRFFLPSLEKYPLALINLCFSSLFFSYFCLKLGVFREVPGAPGTSSTLSGGLIVFTCFFIPFQCPLKSVSSSSPSQFFLNICQCVVISSFYIKNSVGVRYMSRWWRQIISGRHSSG